jgi:hypothetical protein
MNKSLTDLPLAISKKGCTVVAADLMALKEILKTATTGIQSMNEFAQLISKPNSYLLILTNLYFKFSYSR